MVDEPGNILEEALRDRLRREAESKRPAFSESLHAKIMAAVEASEPTAQVPPARRPTGRFAAYAAAAAACAAAVLVAVSWREPDARPVAAPGHATARSEPVPDPIAGLNALAKLGGETASDVGELVNTTLGRTKWAYLDRDAETAARLLADRLPLEMLIGKEER